MARPHGGRRLVHRNEVAQLGVDDDDFIREVALGEEIRWVPMEKARGLPSGTEMPIPQVATRSGFSESKHLSTAFRRDLGLTPTEYRHRSRARRGDR